MLADSWAMSAAGRTARRSSSRSSTARVVWLCGHDLLVVRELAVDQPADEVDPVEVEEDLVAAAGQDDLDRVVDVGQDPRQLVERTGRDHDAGLRDGIEDRDGLDRDPVVVGRGERQLVALEPGQDAGQDRPGLVAGGGERGLGQGPAEDVLGDPRGRSLAGGPDRRELVGVDALDVGLEPAAAEVERVAGLELEVDPVARRQRVDEVGQELGRDGRGAVRLDLAGHPVGDPDLEVGGGQLEPGVLGLEQDVGQDRQGAPVGDGATDDGQAARQVLLHDREFHVGHSTLVAQVGRACGCGIARLGCRTALGLGSPDGSWVSSLYLLTPSSPSSWCGLGGRRRSWPCSARRWTTPGRRWTAAARIGGWAGGTPVDEPAGSGRASRRCASRLVHETRPPEPLRRRRMSTAAHGLSTDSGPCPQARARSGPPMLRRDRSRATVRTPGQSA